MLQKPTLNPDLETEINLADLFRYLLTKWKTILLCALIGVIALGIFSFVQTKLTPEQNEQTVIDDFLKDVAKAKSHTDDDIARLNQIAEAVVKEYSVMRDQQDYYAASMIPGLDWKKVTTVKSVWQLRLEDDATYDNLVLLESAYNDRLNSDEFYNTIRDSLGVDTRDLEVLLKAVASISQTKSDSQLTSTSNSSKTSKQTTESNSVVVSGSNPLGNTVLLTISISGADEDFGNAVVALAKEHMSTISKDMEAAVGKNTFISVQNTVSTGSNRDVLDFQKQASVAGWTEYNTNVTELEKGLTAAEIKYIKAKSDQKLYETGLKTKKEAEPGSPISKLMLVIGLVLGGMVGVCIYALPYMITGKETVHLELRDNYGIRVLLKADKKPGFRFGKDRTYSADELATLIIAELSAGEDNVGNLLIAGNPCDDTDKAFADKLTKALSEKRVNAFFAKDAMFAPETVSSALAADAVLLLERLGTSDRATVTREITWCVDHDKPVFAAVVTIA